MKLTVILALTIIGSLRLFGQQSSNCKPFEKQPQVFTISVSKDTSFTCAEGTVIRISANSFVYSSTKKIVSDSVELKLTEFYKISDILFSNLPATSKGKLLETNGMVYIQATSKKGSVELRKGYSISIGYPVQKLKTFESYFSPIAPDHRSDWQLHKQNELVFFIVEQMPKFPYGDFNTYIKERVVYPENIRALGIKGKVYVRFKVDKFGEVQAPIVTRGLHPQLDSAALDAFNDMPRWQPGKQQGEPVDVYYTCPVDFMAGSKTEKGIRKGLEAKEQTKKLMSPIDYDFHHCYIESFGWKAGARLLAFSPTIDFCIDLEKTDQRVRVVYDHYKAVQEIMPQNGKYCFRAQASEPISIVLTKQIAGKYYLSIKETNTSALIASNFIFKEVSPEVMLLELRKLDRPSSIR